MELRKDVNALAAPAVHDDPTPQRHFEMTIKGTHDEVPSGLIECIHDWIGSTRAGWVPDGHDAVGLVDVALLFFTSGTANDMTAKVVRISQAVYFRKQIQRLDFAFRSCTMRVTLCSIVLR